MKKPTANIQAALGYAKRGWPVFPADSSGDKKSHKSAEYSNGARWGATTDARQIKRDFTKWPRAGVGIPTGADTQIIVVDVDTKKGHGKDGLASLKKLERKHGKLPKTLMAKTPSGGLHYYYAVLADGCRVQTSASKIAPGVDIKGEGGMVLAPPSVRPGWGKYVWLNKCAVVDAPPWLLELVAAPDAAPTSGDPKGEPERIARAVAVIPNDDLNWDAWCRIGLAIYRASGASDAGLEAFDVWSQKSDKYDATTTAERWAAFATCPPDEIGMGTLVYEANKASPEWDATANRDDFVSYLPDHKYIYLPTGALWPGKSVNSQLPKPKGSIPTSDWLDKNRAVHQMAWDPGKPKLMLGRLFNDGGWFQKPNATCFNLYRPPAIKPGDAKKAERWVKHVRRVYPDDYDHIIDYLAHRVQHPGIKPNHALVLGGPMGSGKDTLLEPVRHAVGPWNCESIKPKDLFSEFNSFVQTVLLHINEVRDSGEVTRNELYETMKIYEAAPPEVLRCNDKFVPAHYVMNVCGVIYTTNYPNALYLPADDRRHYVAWSTATYDDLGGKTYFDDLWAWYYAGGFEHVAAYLAQRDINQFNPKAPPRKTEAFWTAVNAHRPAEESAMAEAITTLGDPPALTLGCLAEADREVDVWIAMNSKGPAVPNLLRQNGYTTLLNPNDKAKGLWMIGGKRQRVYVRSDLQGRDQLAAISKLKAAKSRR